MANKKYEGALQELALAAADGRDDRAWAQLRQLPGERAGWVARGGLRMAVMAAPFIRPAEWRELLVEFGLAMALPTEPTDVEGDEPVVVASQWEAGDVPEA